MTTTALADWSTPRPFALRRIAADPSVQALVLYSFGEACGYGSRATGNARPDSDLDLQVVEHTPQLKPEAKVASWWRHFQPLKSLPLPVDLIVSGSADAERLAGSRWHVISEAARHGRVLVVQP